MRRISIILVYEILHSPSAVQDDNYLQYMESADLIIKILANTYTKTDLTRRSRLLREFLEKTFFTPDEEEMTKYLISRQATTEDIDAFLTWGKDFFAAFTHENTYKILESLKNQAKSAPVVILYIPYDAVGAEVVKLGRWMRRHVHKDVLLDLHTDPTLLGGCAFVWHGVYRDYSLRYYMLKRREEIHSLIGQYVQKFYKPL